MLVLILDSCMIACACCGLVPMLFMLSKEVWLIELGLLWRLMISISDLGLGVAMSWDIRKHINIREAQVLFII